MTSPPQEDPAGEIKPAPLRVVHPDEQPFAHRHLLADLERSIAAGELRDSLVGPVVLAALRDEKRLDLASGYDASWMTVAVRLSDEYFVRVRQSAGERDWQRDFAQTVTPILVGAARSLQRSADSQALVVRLCNTLAERLRLRLIWPEEADQYNDLTNAIYKACLKATDLESDEVLVQLKGLTVVGPK